MLSGIQDQVEKQKNNPQTHPVIFLSKVNIKAKKTYWKSARDVRNTSPRKANDLLALVLTMSRLRNERQQWASRAETGAQGDWLQHSFKNFPL